MAMTGTGQLVQFVVGLLVGILLTFSLMDRVNFSGMLSSSSGSSSSPSDNSPSDGIPGTQRARTNGELKMNWVESASEVRDGGSQEPQSESSQYLLRPLTEPAVLPEAIVAPPMKRTGKVEFESVDKSSIIPKRMNSNDAVSGRASATSTAAIAASAPRWTPGKEGTLARLKSKGSETVGVNEYTALEANMPTPGVPVIETPTDSPELPAGLEQPYAGIKTGGRGGGAVGAGLGRGGGGGRGGRRQHPPKVSTTFIDDSLNSSEPFYLFDEDGNRYGPSEAATKFSEQTLLPYPPLPPYHAQTSSYSPAFLPTLQSIQAARTHALVVASEKLKPMPNMTYQRAVFEPTNLKLHLCNGQFEAYSAAYLTTKEHVLAGTFVLACKLFRAKIRYDVLFSCCTVKSENFNLSWVNCEMASFTHLREHNNFYSNPSGHGMIIQVEQKLC
jgi:hypothetical protein